MLHGSVQLKASRTTGGAHNVLGLGRPGLPIPHFYRQGPGPARPPKPSLLSTRPGPARHPNPSLLSTGIPHFYRQGLDSPAPQPLTSIGQTPHFYQLSQPAPMQKIVSPANHRCNCSAPNATINCTLPNGDHPLSMARITLVKRALSNEIV